LFIYVAHLSMSERLRILYMHLFSFEEESNLNWNLRNNIFKIQIDKFTGPSLKINLEAFLMHISETYFDII
jgi:hypothetical protein